MQFFFLSFSIFWKWKGVQPSMPFVPHQVTAKLPSTVTNARTAHAHKRELSERLSSRWILAVFNVENKSLKAQFLLPTSMTGAHSLVGLCAVSQNGVIVCKAAGAIESCHKTHNEINLCFLSFRVFYDSTLSLMSANILIFLDTGGDKTSKNKPKSVIRK